MFHWNLRPASEPTRLKPLQHTKASGPGCCIPGKWKCCGSYPEWLALVQKPVPDEQGMPCSANTWLIFLMLVETKTSSGIRTLFSGTIAKCHTTKVGCLSDITMIEHVNKSSFLSTRYIDLMSTTHCCGDSQRNWRTCRALYHSPIPQPKKWK